jgi:hypothetical protein
MTFFNPNEANREAAAMAQGNHTRPESLDQYAAGDGQQGRQPLHQIGDRAQTQFPLIGKDGQQEQQQPILHVNNFDRTGNSTGTSEYKYSDYQPNGVKLNGYVDRDAQGNVKEFAVRKPALFADQKDVFMVFRPTPGHPIDENQMKHVFELLRPDVPQAQRLQNQKQLNDERPLSANLMHNVGNQVMAIRLDPVTGQRFTIRDMRIDPNTGNAMASGQHPMLCWQGADGKNYRYDVGQLPDADKADVGNATWHGNMRAPLTFLHPGGQQRQMRRPIQPQMAPPGQPQPPG